MFFMPSGLEPDRAYCRLLLAIAGYCLVPRPRYALACELP